MLRFGAGGLLGSSQEDLRGREGWRVGQRKKLNHDASKTGASVGSMWNSGAEVAPQRGHKLCPGAMHSTPHWPVIRGGSPPPLPPGRDHSLWQREILREGLSWEWSATNPLCSWAMCVSSWRASGKHLTTSTTSLSKPLSRPLVHIHHRLTMKPILTMYSLPLHTWVMGTTPTRHFQVTLTLSLSSEVTKFKIYTRWYHFSKFQWM